MFRKIPLKIIILVGLLSIFLTLVIKPAQFLPFLETTITIDLQSGSDGKMQLFYSSDGSYTEENSIKVNVKKNDNLTTYTATLKAKNVKFLRIDPAGDFKIRSIAFQNILYSYKYEGQDLFSRIQPLNHISKVYLNSNNIIVGAVTGGDPHFNLEDIPDLNSFPFYLRALLYLVFALFIFLIFILSYPVIIRFYKILNLKKKYFIWLNVLMTLLVFGFPPEAGLYLKYLVFFILVLVLPGYLLLRVLANGKIRFNLLSLFVTSVACSISLFIILLFLLDEFNIQSNGYFIYLASLGLLLIVNSRSFFAQKISVLADSASLWYWFLLNILLFVFLFPTKGLLVAPLHDPMANSYMAQFLIDSSYTALPKYLSFYPPGMSYIVALLADISSINPAKTVLITTNLFNVLSGFAFALFFTWLFYEKRMYPFFLFSFIFLSGFVAFLYWGAGKNSQIMSYFLTFSALYFYTRSQTNSFKLIALSFALITTSILIHFNSVIIVIFFAPLVFFKENISKKNTFDFFKNILNQVLIASPFLIFFMLLFFRGDLVERARVDDESSVMIFSSIWNSLELSQIWTFLKSACHGDYTIVTTVLGIMTSVGLLIFNKNKRLPVIFALLLIPYLYFISMGGIGAFSRYNGLNIFLIEVIFSGIFIYALFRLFKTSLLRTILIGILLLYGTYNLSIIFKEYWNVKRYSVVVEGDMVAYEWIKNNTPENSYFLPSTFKRRPAGKQWYQLEGSLYLKVFSDREDAISFTTGDSFMYEQEKLKQKYSSLIENPSDKDVLSYFLKKDITYIYDGAYKPWGTPDINPKIFENYPEHYQVVYDSLGVKIYKMYVGK